MSTLLDLESVRFQARTLTIGQLLWFRARFWVLSRPAVGELRIYFLARVSIYHDELVQRWLILRARIAVWRSRMLITRADESLFQYLPEMFEVVRPEIMDLLWAGETIEWHTGVTQWREFEVAIENGGLVWNEDHTQFLVNIVLYSLEDGVTTSAIVGTFWRTPTK